MKIPDDRVIWAKVGARVGLTAGAFASLMPRDKEICREVRYTLDLGAANPLKRRTEGD